MFDMKRESRENLLEIVAVGSILSPVSSVCGYTYSYTHYINPHIQPRGIQRHAKSPPRKVSTCVYIYTHIHIRITSIHTYSHAGFGGAQNRRLDRCLHVCAYIHIYIYALHQSIHTATRNSAARKITLSKGVYTHVYTHTYTYTHYIKPYIHPRGIRMRAKSPLRKVSLHMYIRAICAL